MVGRLRRRLPWSTLLGLILVVATAAALATTLGGDGATEPHGARFVLVGPAVLAGPLAQDVSDGSDPPFDARAVEDRGAAEDQLARGDAVAALVIDLSATRDTLVLPSARSPELDAAVEAEVRVAEAQLGRTVSVERLGGRSSDGVSTTTLGYAAALLGFLVVLVVSLAWGPFARTLPRGLLRLFALIGTGAAAGLVVALVPAASPAGPGGVAVRDTAVLLALAVLAAGSATLALEALTGLGGLLIAATGLLLLPLPVLLAGDPLLLGQPWSTVSSWTLVGATADGVRGVTAFSGSGHGRALAVLLATATVAVAVLSATRFVGARESPSPIVRPGQVPTTAQWRWQLVGLLAAMAASTALVLVVLPDRTALRSDGYSLASSSECVSTGPVRGVDDLNRITQLRGSAAFQGGDVGADVLLQDGRRIFMFGDTLRSDDVPGGQFVRNSMLVFGPDCLQVVLPADGGAIIPERGGGVGYWPMSLASFRRPSYDLVIVSAQRVRTTGEGAFDFENIGPSVAQFVVPRGGTPQLVSQQDIGADDADPSRPMWGAATVADHGWLYLYGTHRSTTAPTDGRATGFALAVARVRPRQVMDEQQWRYWDGNRWGTDPGRSVDLVGEEGGVSQTLSAFERDGLWYAFSKRNEFLGSDLVFWTAPGPQGPFTVQPTAGHLPSEGGTGLLRYMPLAHPDLFPATRSVLVSYSQNSADFGEVLEDPLLYRPRFLRVPLPDLD